jgi:hypothetical protein
MDTAEISQLQTSSSHTPRALQGEGDKLQENTRAIEQTSAAKDYFQSKTRGKLEDVDPISDCYERINH